MNWSKGLFRLWIILSASWLIFGIVLMYANFSVILDKKAYYSPKDKPEQLSNVVTFGDLMPDKGKPWEKYEVLLVPVDIGSAKYKAARKAVLSGQYEIIDVPPNSELFVSSNDDNKRKKELSKLVYRAQRQEYNELWQREFDSALENFIAAFVVPPLVTLAFGAALGWAFQGFRS